MPGFIYLHNPNSEGGANLARGLGIRRIRHEGSTFRGGPRKTVINWGSSQLPRIIDGSRILNLPERVARASNKLAFFQQFTGDNAGLVVPWTGDSREALRWLEERETVVARTILNGSGAAGLVLVSPDRAGDLPRAQLYTKYVMKKDEYRVHVVNGQSIDVQRKSLRRDFAEAAQREGREINWKVRNLENGFIYQRENLQTPQTVIDVAVRAVQTLGLDFGAVDVIYNEQQRRAYVLEVNTAPGLEGTTVENYVRAFRGLL